MQLKHRKKSEARKRKKRLSSWVGRIDDYKDEKSPSKLTKGLFDDIRKIRDTVDGRKIVSDIMNCAPMDVWSGLICINYSVKAATATFIVRNPKYITMDDAEFDTAVMKILQPVTRSKVKSEAPFKATSKVSATTRDTVTSDSDDYIRISKSELRAMMEEVLTAHKKSNELVIH